MPKNLRRVCVILTWSRSGAAEPVPEPILTVGRYFSKSRRRETSLAARLFLLAVTAERLQSTRISGTLRRELTGAPPRKRSAT